MPCLLSGSYSAVPIVVVRVGGAAGTVHLSLQLTDLLMPDVDLLAEFKQTGIGITDDGDGGRAYI